MRPVQGTLDLPAFARKGRPDGWETCIRRNTPLRETSLTSGAVWCYDTSRISRHGALRAGEKMKDNRQTRMENDLGRDDIRKLVRRIALPSMLAQFVSVLYSIVDRMYIGHIPEVGNWRWPALAYAGRW